MRRGGAQAGDVAGQQVAGGPGWVVAPDPGDQPLDRDDPAHIGGQRGEHRALLRMPDGDRPAAGHHLHRA
jgi:hypothetical protein